MALLGISVSDNRMQSRTGAPGDLTTDLRRALAPLPPHAPVVIMIHGFRYDPNAPDADPHRLLFAPEPERSCTRVRSWPGGLGIAPGCRDALCIGFGWEGCAPRHALLPDWAQLGPVYARAGATGQSLARLIRRIGRIAPQRKVHVIAHSLGARVALGALPWLARAMRGRMILMGAAEFECTARAALDACHPALRPEIINVTARQNRIFDRLLERLGPAPEPGPTPGRHVRALGRGLSRPEPGWLDLPLCAPQTREMLTARGIDLAPPSARISHWDFYMRAGALEFYRRLLLTQEHWPLETLRTALAPAAPRPRLHAAMGAA